MVSCKRLRWEVVSSTEVRTDHGKVLDLLLDPPAVVKTEVIRAVRRWRWRNMKRSMPELSRGGSGVGALMEPVWSLLKPRANNEEWKPALRGSLRSAIAGRQYP